jgi:hypothetical protein
MSVQIIITRIHGNIDTLPGDLFNVKADYLAHVPEIAGHDIESAIVKLGKAGERLAKGCLEFHGVGFNQNDSFDTLIRLLTPFAHYSPTLIVGLRTVLKYRNQSAHDSDSTLSVYDLDAAVSSFCAAYQAAYSMLDHTNDRKKNYKDKTPGTVLLGITRQEEKETPAGFFTNPVMKKIGFLNFFTAAMLLWAVAVGGPYSFFLLLRIVVTTNAVLVCFMFYKRNDYIWLLFLGVAILFNPVLPVHLTRSVWKTIDLIVMFLFVVSGISCIRERA